MSCFSTCTDIGTLHIQYVIMCRIAKKRWTEEKKWSTSVFDLVMSMKRGRWTSRCNEIINSFITMVKRCCEAESHSNHYNDHRNDFVFFLSIFHSMQKCNKRESNIAKQPPKNSPWEWDLFEWFNDYLSNRCMSRKNKLNKKKTKKNQKLMTGKTFFHWSPFSVWTLSAK